MRYSAVEGRVREDGVEEGIVEVGYRRGGGMSGYGLRGRKRASPEDRVCVEVDCGEDAQRGGKEEDGAEEADEEHEGG